VVELQLEVGLLDLAGGEGGGLSGLVGLLSFLKLGLVLESNFLNRRNRPMRPYRALGTDFRI